ncbi:Aerobic-type carbon monoxide dehydrogenase, small subunit, CoxS/CutS family [Chelatococcus sambhunathii]|uniref:Aerobic-type carbon monoxide dehydrogenase, small subunit, CoxS/CutS family n=1 Tax=Chelatococcus sambhunathii TaxID=363953 RepID=A0ABP2ACQ7_9HYPH|nr:(2Fe-2S)-binding protein [Chelatococcus sambhunathii]CUA90677.1 Aerobic-type carbon monoxide dehydrogenase, small subunit, CoxS/CutS family [Chelatococcus sambhunathii]
MFGERIALDLEVNGKPLSGVAEPRTLLSDFLRHNLGFTGVHVGCEHGVCGACTVLLDDQPVRSCLMFAVQARHHSITTIEGLAKGGEMHPVQDAFRRHHGLQCGFCTPGMVLTAVDLIQREPDPSERSVREGMSGNLCRCTGYEGIVQAVLAAAKDLKRQSQSNRTEETQ